MVPICPHPSSPPCPLCPHQAYFEQFGELTDLFVPLRNPNAVGDEAHKGIAFVSFKEKDDYDEILSRDKYEIKPNQFIVVDKAAGKEKDGPAGGKRKDKSSKGAGAGACKIRLNGVVVEKEVWASHVCVITRLM